MAILNNSNDVFLVLVAPFVGSFLALLVYRLPTGQPILWGRSICPACGEALGISDLIPVVSWLCRLGRSRCCNQPISVLYPALEIGAALVALWSLSVVPGWVAWIGALLGWTLLALAAIDARHFVLPDTLTMPLMCGGLLLAWTSSIEQLLQHTIGAAAGFTFAVLVAWAYQNMRRQQGLGMGDAKLLAAAGAWVSWTGLPSVLMLAATLGLTGALIRPRIDGKSSLHAPLPFGPYIAIGLWLVWLYGPLVID